MARKWRNLRKTKVQTFDNFIYYVSPVYSARFSRILIPENYF